MKPNESHACGSRTSWVGGTRSARPETEKMTASAIRTDMKYIGARRRIAAAKKAQSKLARRATGAARRESR